MNGMNSAMRYVVDMDTGRVGQVVAEYEGSVFLRPPGGGRQWAVAPHRLRPPTDTELRVARLYGTPVVTR
ncbi:hypothetical protein ACFYM2_02120 [Streptomyces sp. NPDC006711]|uniref:hypothetical protein n=1 Tax=Streptomyces sp. NPDC006711 TaxID=3364762 RepID=UPI0036911FCB